MGRHAFHSELLVHEVDAATRDPEVAATLREYFYNLDRGVYKRLDPLLVASVFQKVNENPPDRYDAYAYMLIHTEIGVGHYATCTIPVGHCPSEDKAVAENNEKLKNVPDIFQVYFRPQHGANGGNDGLLSWEREVGLWLHVRVAERRVERASRPKAKCVTPKCDRPVWARGLCGTCYQRLRNRGELSTLKRGSRKIEEVPGEWMGELVK